MTKTKQALGQQLKRQLQQESNRLSKARELLLSGDIEADDYRTIKSETEKRITRLEAQLTDSVADNFNIEPLWDKAISNLSQLDYLYQTGDVVQKRKIIGSMFPEKLTFDGFQYRTARVNEALNCIMLIDSKLRSKKKGTNPNFSDLSHQVIPLGSKLSPNCLINSNLSCFQVLGYRIGYQGE